MMMPLPPLHSLTEDSRIFFRLWDGWRAGRLLPYWRDVDFGLFGALLPRVLVIEVKSATAAPFLFVGSEVERQLGQGESLIGADYIAMVPPEMRTLRGELLLREVSQPCAAANINRLRYASGEEVAAEVVSAPVRPDADDQPMRLLALVSGIPAQGASADFDHAAPSIGAELRFFDIGAGIPSTRGS
ncbi:PAS domain-containing protein [Ferrovibrio sp.]|uniref:PAS domain-containing protein n=1 Tax=Ferrovibrio sp. TaxID=1917215 RepID=UPI0035AF38C8